MSYSKKFQKLSLIRTIFSSIVTVLLLGPCGQCCGPGRGAGRRRSLRNFNPLVFKQHVPNVGENTLGGAGLAEGRIQKGDPRFAALVPNYNSDIYFTDEEGNGYDHLMTERCRESLDTLAISVMNRWPGVHLRVIEAFDESDLHEPNSLHYEGRAVDITTTDKDYKKQGMLARLAVLAGFDWVYYESRTRVHCSVKSEYSERKRMGGCFPGSSMVDTPHGRLPLKRVKEGDQIKVLKPDGTIAFSPVLLFLHKQFDSRTHFLLLKTNNTELHLTPSHLVMVLRHEIVENSSKILSNEKIMENSEMMFAGAIPFGSYLINAKSKRITLEKIIHTDSYTGEGIFAPLTAEGTVVVDDIVTSCYAVIDSQTIAHWSFLPIRLYNSIKNSIVYALSYVGLISNNNSNNNSSASDNNNKDKFDKNAKFKSNFTNKSKIINQSPNNIKNIVPKYSSKNRSRFSSKNRSKYSSKNLYELHNVSSKILQKTKAQKLLKSYRNVSLLQDELSQYYKILNKKKLLVNKNLNVDKNNLLITNKIKDKNTLFNLKDINKLFNKNLNIQKSKLSMKDLIHLNPQSNLQNTKNLSINKFKSKIKMNSNKLIKPLNMKTRNNSNYLDVRPNDKTLKSHKNQFLKPKILQSNNKKTTHKKYRDVKSNFNTSNSKNSRNSNSQNSRKFFTNKKFTGIDSILKPCENCLTKIKEEKLPKMDKITRFITNRYKNNENNNTIQNINKAKPTELNNGINSELNIALETNNFNNSSLTVASKISNLKFNNSSTSKNDDNFGHIHWYPKLLYTIASWILPSHLVYS